MSRKIDNEKEKNNQNKEWLIVYVCHRWPDSEHQLSQSNER